MNRCTCGHGLTVFSASDPAPCEYCLTAPVVVVGEAFGRTETQRGLPFQGSSGGELREQLKLSNITHAFLTNTINSYVSRFESILVTKKQNIEAFPAPLMVGKYLPLTYKSEITRLHKEIEAIQPRLVITLGNTALWALTMKPPKISKMRGTLIENTPPVLPTYHPSAVLRQFRLRAVVMADLNKARRIVSGEYKIKERHFTVLPSKEEITDFFPKLEAADIISFDIETLVSKYITCIGFAPSDTEALVIPFVHDKQLFWKTTADEIWAWKQVQKILALPNPKLGQNGLYDIQYLYRQGIYVRNYLHDTMLLQHALQPELDKGLAFLVSVYLDEPEWKSIRDVYK